MRGLGAWLDDAGSAASVGSYPTRIDTTVGLIPPSIPNRPPRPRCRLH